MKNLYVLPLLLLGVSCAETFSGKNADTFFAVKEIEAPVEVIEAGDKIVISNLETENFIQKSESNKIDILWIVDNSGSMSDEQADLIRNFDLFIQDFISKNVDFKMAITTTDPRKGVTTNFAGLMVKGSEEKLNSAAAQLSPVQFVADFKELVNVGIKGSGNEQGLQAVKSFNDRYPLYFRPEAYLAVVYISDEEDSSPGTPEENLAYLKALKSNAGLVKAYSIVDKNLKNAGNGLTLGFKRYAAMAEGTGGIVADITASFAEPLAAMSNDLIYLLDSFALASAPKPNTLKVYVNDILVNDYVYDSLTKSIKFNQGSIPAVGEKIKVLYQK